MSARSARMSSVPWVMTTLPLNTQRESASAWLQSEASESRVIGWLRSEALARAGTGSSAAGTTAEDFDEQLRTLRSFYSPRPALAFASSENMPQLMQRVVDFANGQKLLGEDGNGLSRLGISFGDSLVMGNNKQIKLRFDPTYLQLATDQQL